MDKEIDIRKVIAVAQRAIAAASPDYQIARCVEELMELGDALMKRRRSRVTNLEVMEEVADVLITSMEMMLLFGGEQQLQEILEEKMRKAIKQIEKYKAEK